MQFLVILREFCHLFGEYWLHWKSQLILPLGLRRRGSEKMLPWNKELLCLWRILFICCLFASKPHNLHTTITGFSSHFTGEILFLGTICIWCYFCGIRKWSGTPPIAFEFSRIEGIEGIFDANNLIPLSNQRNQNIQVTCASHVMLI